MGNRPARVIDLWCLGSHQELLETAKSTKVGDAKP